MEKSFYAEYAEVEATHWWFTGRKAILRALLPTIIPSHPDTRILDLGFGTGTMLQFYSPYGAVVGCDLATEAIHFARERGCDAAMVQGSGADIPLADDSFDLVSMLDIVEHVDDDANVVAEAARCAKPGGVVLVAVPAFQLLWGNQDILSHHKKRYRLPQVTALLARAGLDIECATYINTVLFPSIAAVRLLRRMLPGSRDESDLRSDFALTKPGRMNNLLASLFSLEGHAIRRGALPFGATVLAAGRKPEREAPAVLAA